MALPMVILEGPACGKDDNKVSDLSKYTQHYFGYPLNQLVMYNYVEDYMTYGWLEHSVPS